MSTPLTDDQYSELVVALEVLRQIAVGVEFPLRRMWNCGEISPFAFVYLVQWFYKLSVTFNTSTLKLHWIPHMVAELCEERC